MGIALEKIIVEMKEQKILSADKKEPPRIVP
jgi:hypothetical protein